MTETPAPAAETPSDTLPEIPWLYDHDKAFAEAKKSGKPVLIDFWCGT